MLSVERETAVDGTLILHVYGLLDLTTILPFRDALFTALGERPAHIELDLTGIRGFDAAGVSTLTTVMRVAATVRVPIQIVPSPELRDLLEETRLSRVLSVLPTGDDVARAIFGRK
jgi:anti-anti-sigma factor